MSPKTDLDRVLADLRRQRTDLETELDTLTRGERTTAEVLDKLKELRLRAQTTDDETLRIRRK